MFAKYHSSETRPTYYLGAWFITSHQQYPHTTRGEDGRQVTRQGHAMLVGIRQGEGSDDSGFRMRRYTLPDTEIPQLTCPMCGSHDFTEPHWNGYVADATECRDCDARMGTEAATPGSEVYEFIRANRAA